MKKNNKDAEKVVDNLCNIITGLTLQLKFVNAKLTVHEKSKGNCKSKNQQIVTLMLHKDAKIHWAKTINCANKSQRKDYI